MREKILTPNIGAEKSQNCQHSQNKHPHCNLSEKLWQKRLGNL